VASPIAVFELKEQFVITFVPPFVYSRLRSRARPGSTGPRSRRVGDRAVLELAAAGDEDAAASA
jgi:hypothetical protein